MRRLPYLLLVVILAALGSILAFRMNQAGLFPAASLAFIGGTGAILLACIGSGVCARRAFGPPVAGRPAWAILVYVSWSCTLASWPIPPAGSPVRPWTDIQLRKPKKKQLSHMKGMIL